MNAKQVPFEVQWVWAIRQAQIPVGRESFEKATDIINKYPEYFPWEHKYKTIPQEVHDAFKAECYPEREKPIEEVSDELVDGVGLRDQLKNRESAGIVPTNFTQKDLEDFFDEMQEAQQKRMEEEKVEENRVRKIWDKHYKKYGLKFAGI